MNPNAEFVAIEFTIKGRTVDSIALQWLIASALHGQRPFPCPVKIDMTFYFRKPKQNIVVAGDIAQIAHKITNEMAVVVYEKSSYVSKCTLEKIQTSGDEQIIVRVERA